MQKSRSKWLTLDKKLSPLTPWTARRKSWHQKSRPFFHTRNQLLEITTFVVPSSRGPPWSKGGAAPRRSQLLQLLEVVTWRTWRKKHRQKTGEYLDFFDIQCFLSPSISSLSFDLFSFNMFQSSILIWISLISLSLILNITPLFYSLKVLGFWQIFSKRRQFHLHLQIWNRSLRLWITNVGPLDFQASSSCGPMSASFTLFQPASAFSSAAMHWEASRTVSTK